MKKYNLATMEGGISKGSHRPQERAYREGMDGQRRRRTRVFGVEAETMRFFMNLNTVIYF